MSKKQSRKGGNKKSNKSKSRQSSITSNANKQNRNNKRKNTPHSNHNNSKKESFEEMINRHQSQLKSGLNIPTTFDSNNISMYNPNNNQYLSFNNELLFNDENNLEESLDPFLDWQGSKHRNDLLKWVQSLNFLYVQSNNNKGKTIKRLNEDKKEKKTIELITTFQENGICSISDLLLSGTEKMKQLLNEWQIRGQQKKQFLFALKSLKNVYAEKKSKLSTDTAIAQAFMQRNNKNLGNKDVKMDKYNLNLEEKSNANAAKQNIKIINGSKIMQQITHLMDIQHFEDAIFLTEKALKIMDQQFGYNLIEKTHSLLSLPMYYLPQNADKNQNVSGLKSSSQSTDNVTVNVNYNININININGTGSGNINQSQNGDESSTWLPTAPSITQSFNTLLSQFKFNNKLSSLFDEDAAEMTAATHNKITNIENILPMVRSKKESATSCDIIRLETRGTLIDLSPTNADLVPLGLLRRMYPIVLWQSGRSRHGLVAIGEILSEQGFNSDCHAIHAALLYQVQKYELCKSAVLKALNLSHNKCVLARLVDILLDRNKKFKYNKVCLLLQYMTDSSAHIDYFNRFGSNLNSLVHDNCIIEGVGLSFDHLIYGLYVRELLYTVHAIRDNQYEKKKKSKELEDVCKKLLHLKPACIALKFAVGQLFVYLNKLEDGGALYRENLCEWIGQKQINNATLCDLNTENTPYFVRQSCLSYGLFLQKYKKDYKTSLSCFNALIGAYLGDAECSDIYKYFAYSLSQIEERNKALKYYELSISKAQKVALPQTLCNIANYLQIATLLARQKKMAQSEKYFCCAAELDGENDDVYLLWSSCLLLCGQYEAAMAKLGAMQNSHEMEYLYLRAMIYYESGKLKECEHAFKLLLRQYPLHSDGHCYYANCLADLNKREVAEKHWEDAININNNNINAHYFYGLWLFYNQEINKAIYHLKECLRIDVKHNNSRFILAHIQFQRKQFKEAEKHFKIICENDKNAARDTHKNMIYFKNYGDCLIQIGDKQGAVEKYTKSLKLLKILKGNLNANRKRSGGDVCLCKYYLNNNNNAAAICSFYNAFECETREKLATILSRCKELKSAYSECEKCLKLCPNHIEAIFRFASILSNLKKYKKAEKYFKKCLEKSAQKHGKCWNNYGVMKLNMNKYDDAMHFFKKALYVLKQQPNAIREVQKNIDLCTRKQMESMASPSMQSQPQTQSNNNENNITITLSVQEKIQRTAASALRAGNHNHDTSPNSTQSKKKKKKKNKKKHKNNKNKKAKR